MDFSKFEYINDLYLPVEGEGDSFATQIVTAVNKIVYRWYNDGDVYDNSYFMNGFSNDLSSFANWLHKNTPLPRIREVLEGIHTCKSEEEYEAILENLSNSLLNVPLIESLVDEPKVGTVYKCDGPFKFIEPEEEYEEDYDYEEEFEEEEDYEEEFEP